MRRDLLLVVSFLLTLALIGVWKANTWRGQLGHRSAAGARFDGVGASTGWEDTIRRRDSAEDVPNGRPPQIRLFVVREEYAEWFRENRSEPQMDAQSPESIDFTVHQVLVVLWGDKPGAGHDIRVERIEPLADETRVVLVTHAPEWVDDPAIVYPGVAVPVPRGKPVHVVVKGERLRPVAKFVDFQAMRRDDLIVEILPHEPMKKSP